MLFSIDAGMEFGSTILGPCIVLFSSQNGKDTPCDIKNVLSQTFY